MALRALLLRERSSSSTRMLPSISIGDGSRPTVSRRYLWAFRSVVKCGASGMLQRSSGSRLRSPLGSLVQAATMPVLGPSWMMW